MRSARRLHCFLSFIIVANVCSFFFLSQSNVAQETLNQVQGIETAMNSSEHIRQQVVSLQQETDGMVADINYITQTVFQTVIYKLISLFRDFHLTKFCCSYRYESSIMNKKCSCFVIAKYCLTKRANYCLREAEAEFYSFIFILLFLGDSSI